MSYHCECGQGLTDMYIASTGLMVECPEHGLHQWGEVEDD